MDELDVIPYDPNTAQASSIEAQSQASDEIDAIPFDPRSLLSRAASGLKSIPGNIASMITKAPGIAMTLADILAMKPNPTGAEDLMSLLKGGAQGFTAGIYSPEQPITESGQRYADLGQMIGTLAPWSLAAKGLGALGLTKSLIQPTVGVTLGAAAPLVQGDIGGAVEGAVGGAGAVIAPSAVLGTVGAVGRRMSRGPNRALDLAASINEAKISNAKAIEATNRFINAESKANFDIEYQTWSVAQQTAQLSEQRAMQQMTAGTAAQIKASEAFAKDITLPNGEQIRISPLSQRLENKAATDALYDTVKAAQSKPFELKGSNKLVKDMIMEHTKTNNIQLIQPLMDKINWLVAGKPNLAQIRDGLKDLGGFVGQENQLHYQARTIYKSVFDDLRELGKTDPNALAMTKAVASARRDIAAREIGEISTNFGSNTDAIGRIKANAGKVDNYLKTDKYMRESFSPGELQEIYNTIGDVFKWDKETLTRETAVTTTGKTVKARAKAEPESPKMLPTEVPIGKLVEPKFKPGIASRHPAAIPHMLAAGGITGMLGIPAGAAYGMTVGAVVFGPRLIFRMAMTPMGRTLVRKFYEGTPPLANDMGRFMAMANFLQSQEQAEGQQ